MDLQGLKGDHYEVIEEFVAAVLESESSTDLCRRLVHSKSTTGDTVGAQLMWLNLEAELVSVAHYGRVPQPSNYSLWSDNAPARALRTKLMVVEQNTLVPGMWVTILPLLRGELPVGALLLTSKGELALITVNPAAHHIMGRIAAYYLFSIGFISGQGLIESAASADEYQQLTVRQRKILNFMAVGLTNVEIASELMLSESTIRQETVRIFRALGVHSRELASQKGRALGLVERQPTTKLVGP